MKPKKSTSPQRPPIIFERLISSAEAKKLISQAAAAAEWRGARVVSVKRQKEVRREDTKVRSAKVAILGKRSASHKLILRNFDQKLSSKVVRKYQLEEWEVSEIQILKYLPGDYFRPHTDTGSINERRVITVVTYLSDDFSGGETAFPNYNFEVKPRAGYSLVFPSDVLHEAREVTEGVKFAAVFWLQSLTTIEWI